MIKHNEQWACRRRVGFTDVRAGFTLIEVLVVVAIIATLVAILLPSLAKARAQSRAAVCLSGEKQMGVAMTMFATEHGGRVPRGLSRHGTPDASGPVNWVRMIVRMFGDKKNYAENFNRVPVERHPIFSCPERARQYGRVFLDYVVNSTDHRGPINITTCAQDKTGGLWYEVEGVTKLEVWDLPGETIYISEAVEEDWKISDPRNAWLTMRGIRENIAKVRAQIPPSDTGFDWFDVAGGRNFPTYKTFAVEPHYPRASLKMHGSGSNAVFVDGHAQMVKPPPQSAGVQAIHEFYMRRYGVQRRAIPGSTAMDTTADNSSPCVAGDTKWRP